MKDNGVEEMAGHNKSVRIKKSGMNTTMIICFWCGKSDSIGLLGAGHGDENHQELEAPRNMVMTYEPCPKCAEVLGLRSSNN